MNSNNWNNAANNEDDELGDLLFTAELIIGSDAAGDPVNYNDLSSVLHDIGVHPEIDQRIENDPAILQTLDRLQAIQDRLAGAHHAAQAAVHIGAPIAVAAPEQNYSFTNLNNNGRVKVPKNTTNVIQLNTVRNGNEMINFQGERDRGYYYRKANFKGFTKNKDGFRLNPRTRARIEPGSVRRYTANVSANLPNNLRSINTSLFVEEGGKRKGRKTRKAKKVRKTRKAHRKH